MMYWFHNSIARNWINNTNKLVPKPNYDKVINSLHGKYFLSACRHFWNNLANILAYLYIRRGNYQGWEFNNIILENQGYFKSRDIT